MEVFMYEKNVHIIHIIIRGQKTRGHETDNDNDNKSDIFHNEIMDTIKKLIKEKKWGHIIGDNPDIDIEKGKVILKGRGDYRGRSKNTGLTPNDFDLLELIIFPDNIIKAEYIVDETIYYYVLQVDGIYDALKNDK